MAAGAGNILIRVGADASQAIRELKGVSGPLSDVQTKGERMSAGVRKAALPAAAALTAIAAAGMGAAKAAAEDEAAQTKLAGALKRSTGATEAQVSAAESYIEKLSLATGTADDELRPALAALAAASGDVGTGQERLALALDIAAQSGKPLEQVTKALVGAEQGRTTALGKLVPGLDKATLASKDMTKITEELADKTGGAAAEAADTATGRFKIMQVRMAELQEELGAALLPVLEELGKILSKVAAFAARHTTALKIAIGVVAGFAGAILIANAAMKVYSASKIILSGVTKAWAAITKAAAATQWILNAAMSANPIGIIVLALVALGVGLVIAYKKSETFRNIVGKALEVVSDAAGVVADAFGVLLDAAKKAFDWIKSHWKLALFAFGPIGAAIYLVTTNFDKVKAAATKAFDYIKLVWRVGSFLFGGVRLAIDGIVSTFNRVKDAAQRAFQWIKDAWKAGSFAFGKIADAVGAVADQFRRVYQWARDAIGVVKDLISWIGRIDFPDPPGWLSRIGGVFGGLAGAPAAAGAAAMPYGAPRGAAPRAAGPLAAGLAGGSGSASITINVYGATDPEGTARTIRRQLRGFERRHGPLALVPPR